MLKLGRLYWSGKGPRALFAVVLAIACGVGAVAAADAPSTSVEVVDARRWFELGSQAAAFDQQGRAHVAYGKDHLYYAVRDASGWSTTVVDDATGVGSSSSIALDSTGTPHIAYLDQINGLLKLAILESEGWRINVLAPAAIYGGVSLALDASDSLHVAFEAPSGGIVYGKETAGAWDLRSIEQVEAGVGPRISLLLDSRDVPHIVYLSNSDRHVWHAVPDGAGWTLEDATPHADAWGQSCFLDDEDGLHLSFRNGWSLEYAYREVEGSTWTHDTVSSDCNPAFSSVIVDASGVPRIAYLDWWTSELRLATKMGSIWLVAPVEGGRAPGQVATAGRAGIPLIVTCTGYDSCDLSSSTWHGRTWSSEHIDAGAYVGRESALVVDESGRTWIAYPAGSRATVAVREETGWRIEYESAVVAEAGGFSLAIDPDGWPILSYTAGRLGAATPFADWGYDMVVVRGTTEGWKESIVWTVSGSNQPFDGSMSIAPDGTIGVAHFDYPARLMFSTSNRTDEWIHHTIDDSPGQHVWHSVALAADADGVFHMADAAFVNETGETTLYYRTGPEMEQVEILVESGSGQLGLPSIAVSRDGDVTVLYMSTDDSEGFEMRLWIAERESGEWRRSLVEDDRLGYLGGLILDDFGKAHISYAAFAQFDPEIPGPMTGLYAVRQGGAWKKLVLFEGSDVYPNSIAMDHLANVLVGFHDFRRGDLFLVRVEDPHP
jgi:hypothetical protein